MNCNRTYDSQAHPLAGRHNQENLSYHDARGNWVNAGYRYQKSDPIVGTRNIYKFEKGIDKDRALSQNNLKGLKNSRGTYANDVHNSNGVSFQNYLSFGRFFK